MKSDSNLGCMVAGIVMAVILVLWVVSPSFRAAVPGMMDGVQEDNRLDPCTLVAYSIAAAAGYIVFRVRKQKLKSDGNWPAGKGSAYTWVTLVSVTVFLIVGVLCAVA